MFQSVFDGDYPRCEVDPRGMPVHSIKENHRRTWNSDSVESQEQSIVCSHAESGKSFATPIDLRVLVENERARYFA